MITHQDLANVVQIIDIATKRGAINGEELSAVGQIRDKFVKALEEAQKETESEGQAQPDMTNVESESDGGSY